MPEIADTEENFRQLIPLLRIEILMNIISNRKYFFEHEVGFIFH
jgi:hypothetical protein